ncbi:major facilitator superfamily protein [Corynebacterium deserti GIMN1.010]|uniref:Major facilitator superfamily protein n=1 Tax=Corynebacterium deserti GIMN1.010 TaxID=931089 RepID=A0A0M4CNX3_9CORY|nr:MFS transporter [Corynebacterium deserti]ALC07035.1 major facilitator superfamily protein [Corynebacterium deserti GIMN1.010]
MQDSKVDIRGPVHGTKDAKRVASGSAVGAMIESYDFIGFGTASALYLGAAFFPSQDPMTGVLASFATLGVGFIARPIGGVIGGHLGDKVGRKPVLVASLLLMGLATFLIGCLPTYDQVGVLAPILLVTVRILQGLAFGAEWGGAILMTYEHAPWKSKGFFTSFVQAGFPVGLLLANLVFLVSVALPGDWAWRTPFLFSAVLVIVGMIIRNKVPESPVFDEVKNSGTVVKSPIIEVFRTDWRNIFRGIGLRVAETAGYAVAITYMMSYIVNHEPPIGSNSDTLLALCIAAALGAFATVWWGRNTDKRGRRPQYIYVCAFSILWAFPMFLLVNAGSTVLMIVVFIVSYCVCQNALAGAQGAWFPELFSANVRSSGASLAYQISAMVSGITPFATTLLYIKFDWYGPAFLFAAYALCGLIAAVTTKETWSKDLRDEVDRITSETANGWAEAKESQKI